jgi:hypothetical protein
MLQKQDKENKIFLCLTLCLSRLLPAVDRKLVEAYIPKMDCFVLVIYMMSIIICLLNKNLEICQKKGKNSF